MGDSWKIVKRALVIFGLGMVLALYPKWDVGVVRIPGVLQRIAICYLAAALLFRWTAPARGNDDSRRWAQGRTLMLCAVALTLGYWGAMMLVPVPGGAAGDLTPDGNLGAYIDREDLRRASLGPVQDMGPEGLLSTVPALATTLLGGVAGLWLGSRAAGSRKALWMTAAGMLAMGIGLAWSLVFPLNKALWTSSYVWFTGGAAAVFLALCYALIDLRGWRAWSRPFVILGLNAIALFVLSGLMTKFLSFHKVTGPDGNPVSLLRYAYTTWFVPWRNRSTRRCSSHSRTSPCCSSCCG